MAGPAEFFISTAGEYEPLAAPRACWQNARLRDDVRGDYMLIDIKPALSGQRFGLGATDITQLIISARHRGQTLYPISEWPFFVYVARIVDKAVFESHTFTREQAELIAWGTLFRTREEASDHAKKFQK
jgi:DNA-binding helix-hairpin-helix protein with protein kinase domain